MICITHNYQNITKKVTNLTKVLILLNTINVIKNLEVKNYMRLKVNLIFLYPLK